MTSAAKPETPIEGEIPGTWAVKIAMVIGPGYGFFEHGKTWKTLAGAKRNLASFGAVRADRFVTFTCDRGDGRTGYDLSSLPWRVYVDGMALQAKSGRPRRFQTQRGAEVAVLAALDAGRVSDKPRR